MPGAIGRAEIEAMVLADRVRRSVFTEPAIFDLEMARIFGKTWVYYSYEGNWKRQVANSMDGYHPAVTRRSFFQVLGRRIDKGAGAVLEQFGYDGAASSRAG